MPTKTLIIFTREEFRSWLKKYSKTETRVALILHKKHTGKKSPTHRELIEEAICFGWIDTTIKRVDEDRFLRHFTRRNEKSKWSKNTLSYAKQLLNAGRMTQEGIYFYKLGKSKPTHDHGLPKNPEMPAELRAALRNDLVAKKNFSEFPPSTKKTYYRWLLRAKRPSTRTTRVLQIVQAARKKNKHLLNPQ